MHPDVLLPDGAANRARAAIFTPKALRIDELIAQGKSFDEAFAIAESEYTSDGMLLKREPKDMLAALSGGLSQMGEVQF